MQTKVQLIRQLIAERRTIKPELFNGKSIAREIIEDMLESANWAPNHGLTEPWRFVVFSGREGVEQFGRIHADLYKQETPADQFLQKKYDTILHKPDKASHVVVIVMKRGENKNIPETEERAATACAVQNMLLTAQAYKLAAYWGTGGMCYHPALKAHFGFAEQDLVMGFLYLGYTDEAIPEGVRSSAVQAKTQWM
jgi:nitroreductase